jgi:hypothetical protein
MAPYKPHSWQRRHGPDIVAAVEIIEGSDFWTAATWVRSNPAVIVGRHRLIDNVESAKTKADHLARTQFNHVCTLEACGEWVFAP